MDLKILKMKKLIQQTNVLYVTLLPKTQWYSLADITVCVLNAHKLLECRILNVLFADKLLRNF